MSCRGLVRVGDKDFMEWLDRMREFGSQAKSKQKETRSRPNVPEVPRGLRPSYPPYPHYGRCCGNGIVPKPFIQSIQKADEEARFAEAIHHETKLAEKEGENMKRRHSLRERFHDEGITLKRCRHCKNRETGHGERLKKNRAEENPFGQGMRTRVCGGGSMTVNYDPLERLSGKALAEAEAAGLIGSRKGKTADEKQEEHMKNRGLPRHGTRTWTCGGGSLTMNHDLLDKLKGKTIEEAEEEGLIGAGKEVVEAEEYDFDSATDYAVGEDSPEGEENEKHITPEPPKEKRSTNKTMAETKPWRHWDRHGHGWKLQEESESPQKSRTKTTPKKIQKTTKPKAKAPPTKKMCLAK